MGGKSSKSSQRSSVVVARPQEVDFNSPDELINYLKQNEVSLKNILRGVSNFPDVWAENDLFRQLRRTIPIPEPVNTSLGAVKYVTKTPKGTFDPNARTTFDMYICHAPNGSDEAKTLHAHFEKKIKSTMLNQASSFDSIEEEISSTGCIVLILNSDILNNEKCLFVLRCGTIYEKKILVLHLKDSFAFPKFADQPQEFRDAVLMEDVFIYSASKQASIFKEIDEKLELPERKLDRGGLLTVQILKSSNIATVDIGEVKKIYCIIEFDQNGVVLDAKKDSDPLNPEWKNKAKFDVSRPTLEFTVSLWCNLANGGERFLGTCKPTVSFDTKSHTQTYSLQSVSNDQRVTGSLTVKTTYKKPEGKKKMTIDDFDLLKVIGKGTLGKVMQVRKKDTERIYALKIIKKADVVARNEIEHMIAERQVLAQMHHPYIVNLKFSFQSEDKLYLVLSFVNGGELFHHLQEAGRFDEYRSKFYAAELLTALEYLHNYNIIYRDVKPENILLDYSGHIALCDFGLCKLHMTKGEKTNTFCGTPEYLAPELLVGDGYTNVVDWWTLGILLYEMLAGLPPFYSEDVNEMYRRTVEDELTFPDVISPLAQDLLSKLLEKDPNRRLGAGGATEIKQHPFFQDIDWVKLMQKRIPPPFKPKVASGVDTSNFDEELTTQQPTDSYVEGSKLSDSVQNKFKGFTYTNENKMTYAQTPVFSKNAIQEE